MHPLDSARERLKRANENIVNLNGEVTDFLAPFPRLKTTEINRVWSDDETQTFEELKKLSRDSKVPPRLSVLVGEIIHHLRSAFDHAAWQLSSPAARNDPKIAKYIEFPVFPKEPKRGTEDKPSSYDRKVKGIRSFTALIRIDELQPYKRADPLNHPLWLIHDMDIFDKHRELNLVVVAIGTSIRATGKQRVRAVKDSATGGMRIIGATGPQKVEVYVELSAQVTFSNVGTRENEPTIPLLQQLSGFAADSVELFSSEFA